MTRALRRLARKILARAMTGSLFGLTIGLVAAITFYPKRSEPSPPDPALVEARQRVNQLEAAKALFRISAGGVVGTTVGLLWGTLEVLFGAEDSSGKSRKR